MVLSTQGFKVTVITILSSCSVWKNAVAGCSGFYIFYLFSQIHSYIERNMIQTEVAPASCKPMAFSPKYLALPNRAFTVFVYSTPSLAPCSAFLSHSVIVSPASAAAFSPFTAGSNASTMVLSPTLARPLCLSASNAWEKIS